MDDRIRALESVQATTNQVINDLKDSLNFAEEQQRKTTESFDKYKEQTNLKMTELSRKNNELESNIKELENKSLYLEAYSRQENIKFENIQGGTGHGAHQEDTENVLRNFLETRLGYENARSVELQRLHRLNIKKSGASNDTKPKPIIARFLRYKDCERILSLGHRLKGTEFRMYQDLPHGIVADFNTMIKALKVAWIPRLQSRTDASWKIIPEAAMQNLGGLSFMTYCNYDVNSLQINNLPVFYREVLQQWQSSKHAFRNDTLPHKEIIWNNRNIMIDGKPLFYKCWFENNITRVEDLLDNNGNFLSFNQFSEQYQLKTPFTLYFGLISSIPTQWKSEIVKQKIYSQASNDKNKNSANTISTKTVYSALLKNVFSAPTAESKILRYGFTQENIHRVYELPFKIKNDIKITMFQYKIIHNILATNVSLFRAKILDYDICPQCLRA